MILSSVPFMCHASKARMDEKSNGNWTELVRRNKRTLFYVCPNVDHIVCVCVCSSISSQRWNTKNVANIFVLRAVYSRNGETGWKRTQLKQLLLSARFEFCLSFVIISTIMNRTKAYVPINSSWTTTQANWRHDFFPMRKQQSFVDLFYLQLAPFNVHDNSKCFFGQNKRVISEEISTENAEVEENRKWMFYLNTD